MLQISEATAIALHAAVYIAKNDIVSLKEIANKFNISHNHLSKVLQRMVKAGYLISVKGPAGGFSISEEKKSLTFMEIYETIEGKNNIRSCLFLSNPKKDCSKCIMGNLINNINKEFLKYMNAHKITDFSI